MAYPYIQREDPPLPVRRQIFYLMKMDPEGCQEAIREAGFITADEYDVLAEKHEAERQERIKNDPLGAIRGTEEQYLKIFEILEAGGVKNGLALVQCAQRIHKLNIPQLEEFAHRLVAKIKNGGSK